MLNAVQLDAAVRAIAPKSEQEAYAAARAISEARLWSTPEIEAKLLPLEIALYREGERLRDQNNAACNCSAEHLTAFCPLHGKERGVKKSRTG